MKVKTIFKKGRVLEVIAPYFPIEVFEQLGDYEQEFINNFDEQFFYGDIHYLNDSSISSLIQYSFRWCDSVEGEYYWDEVFDKSAGLTQNEKLRKL